MIHHNRAFLLIFLKMIVIGAIKFVCTKEGIFGAELAALSVSIGLNLRVFSGCGECDFAALGGMESAIISG